MKFTNHSQIDPLTTDYIKTITRTEDICTISINDINGFLDMLYQSDPQTVISNNEDKKESRYVQENSRS